MHRPTRQDTARERELRVVVADDHASIRAAVRSILLSIPGVTLAGEAVTGHEALDLIRAQRPDVALVDIRLDGLKGLEVAERAWAEAPDTAIVLLAMRAEAPPGGKPPAGIAGLVAKEAAATEIPAALLSVAAGRRFISPSLSGTDGGPVPLASHGGATWADE